MQPLSAGDGESYVNDSGRFILTDWLRYQPSGSDEPFILRMRGVGRTITNRKIIYFHNSHDNIGLRMGDEWLTIKNGLLEYQGNEYHLDTTVHYTDVPPDVPNF